MSKSYDLRPAGLFDYLQQLGHLRVKCRCFDVLEEQSGDPLPQPLQTACLNPPSHEVHLSVNQIHDVPGQLTLMLLFNEDKNNHATNNNRYAHTENNCSIVYNKVLFLFRIYTLFDKVLKDRVRESALYNTEYTQSLMKFY